MNENFIPPFQPGDLQSINKFELESVELKLMPIHNFVVLAKIIYDYFGIKVTKEKLPLITTRIQPIMKKYGFANYDQYLQAVTSDQSGNMMSELANHVSTNHTSFFREDVHFKLLTQTILPEIIREKELTGNRDLRVWCAACSTGEEAYTLLFCIMRFLGGEYKNWKAGILATDISARALAKAKTGLYPASRLESVPPDYQLEFFERQEGGDFAVRETMRQEVTFRRLNLMNASYPMRLPFDIVFCRNVMIYFDLETRISLVDKLCNTLRPGGYLFIGHSESVPGLGDNCLYVAPSVYQMRKE
ncbi:MAG: chemotaxis protein CheR [Planctomycetota bacterium]|jgi:chemotaxis protein methyltransferase CheR|nr:chemotaxis protein CheR [Planctomycetota bacterium]